MNSGELERILRKLQDIAGDDRIDIADSSTTSLVADSGESIELSGEPEVRHFNQVRDRVFRRIEDDSRDTADVAVLLCCEKEDTYDFWITFLGDRRKNRFAYIGELPKRLQTEQYWAWESKQDGRFEFNPYAGAVGGGNSIGTTPKNYDGAVIDASSEGAFYQSGGWRGGGDGPVGNIENVEDIPGGDLGGIVTPVWSRVLTGYSVTARTYLQTLCLPLSMYTDVTWEWSDGGGGYALRKVGGDGVTTSSGDKLLGTRWDVNWSHAEGGGSLSVSQVGSPRVVADNQDILPTYNLVLSNGRLWQSKIGFGVEESVRNKPWEPGLGYRYKTCGGGSLPGGVFLPDTNLAVSKYVYGGFGGLEGAWFRPGYNPVGLWGPDAGSGYLLLGFFGDLCGSMPFGVDYLPKGAFVSPTLEAEVYKLDGSPYVIQEKRLVVSEGDKILYDSGWGDSVPSKETWTDPPGESYTIRVFDENEIELGYDSASSPISYSLEKIEAKRVALYIKKDGENINGQFDGSGGPLPPGFEDGEEVPEEYRDFEIGNNDQLPSVNGETTLVIARIDSWVEVAGKKLAAVTLDGQDGQEIIESPQYEEATKPYTGSDGRTVYPCFPQKTEEPPKEETANFRADEGFNAYHVTWYNTRKVSVNGDTTRHEPFDFNNPELSGQLPSPAINYLASLVSTDLIINYTPMGNLSWGKDLPEEGTNLEEEKEEGLDPYGVVYSLVKGFTYALYGPTKVSQSSTTMLIDKKAKQTLLGDYDFTLFSYRNRARKPRLYVLDADKTDEGRPFQEFDVTDLNQRGLSQLELTMDTAFRQQLWGYSLSPIGNEYEEDWATERVSFEENPSGGNTPFEGEYLNNATANSSSVKQRGDKTVDITVKMEDVEALLKATKKAKVEFTIHDSQHPSQTTVKQFEMNPIQDVFEGYSEVKILSVAGIIY